METHFDTLTCKAEATHYQLGTQTRYQVPTIMPSLPVSLPDL